MLPDIAFILQTYRERPTQPARLVGRLLAAAAAANLSVQVLVNDDSGEQPEAWRCDGECRTYDRRVRAARFRSRLTCGCASCVP